jgi:transposase
MANKPFLLPPLYTDELLQLQKLLRAENTRSAVYRRCRLIWELAAGCNLTEASELADLHYTNARLWVLRFEDDGVGCLMGRPRPGRPPIYSDKDHTRIIEIATSRPTDLGLGFTTWSLGKLEEYLQHQKGLGTLSRETIRRVLRRHGLRFLTGETWCESTDPDFEAKKTPS